MSNCKNCGAPLNDGTNFCPNCGFPVAGNSSQQYYAQQKPYDKNSERDFTSQFDNNDIQNNRVLAVFSYISCLVLIPILAGKESKFARFHANQGLVILIFEIATYVIEGILRTGGKILVNSFNVTIVGGWLFTMAVAAVHIFFLVLAIIGIVNVLNSKAEELPVIGKIRILR